MKMTHLKIMKQQQISLHAANLKAEYEKNLQNHENVKEFIGYRPQKIEIRPTSPEFKSLT